MPESSRTVIVPADKVNEGISFTGLIVNVRALLLVDVPSLANTVSVAVPLAFAVGVKDNCRVLLRPRTLNWLLLTRDWLEEVDQVLMAKVGVSASVMV